MSYTYSLRLPVRSTGWGCLIAVVEMKEAFVPKCAFLCQSFGGVKPKGSEDSPLPAAAVRGRREAVAVAEGLAALRVLQRGRVLVEGWCQRPVV